MHKSSVMIVAGALFTLSASADSINVPASADRYVVSYLAQATRRNLGLDLAVTIGGVEKFSRHVPVQTGDHDWRVTDAGDFLQSKPVWNLTTDDVTRSTDSLFHREWVTPTAPVPAHIIPVPEPGALGLVGVALAAIALMRRKRLA
jgi:PEP-CTERM motif-containing protein